MRSGVRLIIGFALIALFSIAAIAFVASRTGGNTKKSETKTDEPAAVELTNYAGKDVTLRMTSVGRVDGEEEHRAVRITVTPSSRKFELMSGYQGTVLSTKDYFNNPAAFNAFVVALNGANFDDKAKTEGDPFGKCMLGKRYIYELIEGGNSLIKNWSTSCGLQENLDIDASTIRKLFQLQITDYKTLAKGTNL